MEFSIWICICHADGNYCAYAPEVPGCMATGDTVEETKSAMTGALESHIRWMLEEGDSVTGIKGVFPLADALEAKQNGEEEYYYLVKVAASVEELVEA
jgi:predicted RNase H-like HicB family nuclease